jgi:hypothetical protein
MGRRPTLDDTNAELLSILWRSPFSSVRTIAGSLGIPVSAVYFHWVEKIGFKSSLLRCVPHLLTDELRLKRVELARYSLELLEDQRIVEFSDIMTEDESRFLQHDDHERMWCLLADGVTTRVRPTISASKTMLTVFLRCRGAIFINYLLLGENSKATTSTTMY